MRIQENCSQLGIPLSPICQDFDPLADTNEVLSSMYKDAAIFAYVRVSSCIDWIYIP